MAKKMSKGCYAKQHLRGGIKKRRLLYAILAVFITVGAAAAVIQVFMYAAWTATIRVPQVKWFPGSDVGATLGGETLVTVDITEESGAANVGLLCYRNRRQVYTDVLRLTNTDTTGSRTVVVTYLENSFKIEDNAGNDVTSAWDENARKLRVYVLDGIATGRIAATPTGYMITDNLGAYDVMLTPAPIMPAALRVDDGQVTYDNVSVTIPAGGGKIIGIYMRLGHFPDNYRVLFGIQAFEQAV